MPLKFKLRKSHHYNVLSRNVLVLNVELIDKTPIECTLSSDSSGLDCLQNVCQRLGLQQSEFFGLRYMSKRPYPKVRWVELDRPLKKQLQKYAQSPALVLAVQYYIHDVGLLQDDVSRTHYFLQVKQDVLEGKLRCNYEQAVLLASYSLQAEFGDHQPERHTPEYLKDFKLFPKQAISEGDVGSLLDAVVWQYSSLTGLAQALAETYYILEAQSLPGYGHETFIARDDKGSEVYLGASLLGIVVQSASGENHSFYRWNTITNLINQRRAFGIECTCTNQTVHFTFEEPDSAKYVWKMCVKQHTFYKGNQEILEGTNSSGEIRGLAIPDIQSNLLNSSLKSFHQISNQKNREMPQVQLQNKEPQLQQSTKHLASIVPIQQQEDSHNLSLFTSSLNQSSSPITMRRALLPQYRTAPDYETALMHKYGPGMTSSQLRTILYSSQPEISSMNKSECIDTPNKNGNVAPYNHNYGDQFYPRELQVPKTPTGIYLNGPLHNTYSTPELANTSYPDNSSQQKHKGDSSFLEYHFIHGYKPPPPYNKNSSNSTPDLVSSSKDEVCTPCKSQKKSPLTASLGCLGPPELSRTYENLTDLNDAVESLRKELTRSSTEASSSFLHSFSPNLSRDDLDVIYQLSNSHVAVSKNFNIKASSLEGAAAGARLNIGEQKLAYQNFAAANDASATNEPIYQNINAILNDIPEERQSGANSDPRSKEIISRLSNAAKHMKYNFKAREEAARNRAISAHAVGVYDNVHLQQQKQPDSYRHLQLENHLQEKQHQILKKKQQQLINYGNQQVQLQYYLPDKQNNSESAHVFENQHPNMILAGSAINPDSNRHSINGLHQKKDFQVTQQHSYLSTVAKPNNPTILSSQKNATHQRDSNKETSLPTWKVHNLGSHQENRARPDVLPNANGSFVTTMDSRASKLEEILEHKDLLQEFESIPKVKSNPDFTSAMKPESISKNSYKDIFPYEENRVKITPSKENKVGYVNASHITASIGESQAFFICAQNPIANTLVDFWQCIWENDVKLIIMLTSGVGVLSSSKSFPYWPQSDNTSVECQQFRIYRKHSTKSAFHTTSRLQLVNVGQRKSRSVWHLQFTDWTDHGCPDDTQNFINFLQELSTLRRVTYCEIEGICKSQNTPVLIHCSDGISRSGVTILCDILIQAIDHNLPIDPPKVLLHLRQQRMSLVPSISHYMFVYKVLVSYLKKARLI